MREFPSVTMYFLISAIISVIYNKDSRICTTYTKYQVPEERHADKTIAIWIAIFLRIVRSYVNYRVCKNPVGEWYPVFRSDRAYKSEIYWLIHVE